MECGIAALDRLWSDEAAPCITASDREAVAAVQGLLIGHGYRRLPTLLSASCGLFGPQTAAAVQKFQSTHALPATNAIDRATLRALVTIPATSPIISRLYAAFVLDISFTGLLRSAAVTMQLEGGGYFGAANRNTDRCGLSFGLIQWAQRPGRLHELLAAFDRADSDRFTRLFGNGDGALAQGLLAHTARTNGGVNARTGKTLDERYDLIVDPWRSRFDHAGRDPVFQRAQVNAALAAFTTSARRIQESMPLVKSERGLVFMLDVANQFGDAGAAKVVAAVTKPGMTEAEFLAAVAQETVARLARKYGAASPEARGTASRRQVIRTTPWLADVPAAFA